MNDWTKVGTANGGHVYMKPEEPKIYAIADVDDNGKLPRKYRHIQWWGVPVNRNNIPDQTCLLTLSKAIEYAIKTHLFYGKTLAEHGEELESGPFRPQGIIHVTPDGLKELAWAWWDDNEAWQTAPLIHVQAWRTVAGELYGQHRVMMADSPVAVVDDEVSRLARFLNGSMNDLKHLAAADS